MTRWRWAAGLVVVGALGVGLAWDWDWFRPMVERQASAALGMNVTLGHFDLRLGRQVVATGDAVAMADPGPFATVKRVSLSFDVASMLRHWEISVAVVRIEQPMLELQQQDSAMADWLAPVGKVSEAAAAWRVGQIQILDGQAHLTALRGQGDMRFTYATTEAVGETPGAITIDLTGNHQGMPITGHFEGGAPLSLRDAAVPYPASLRIQSGPTLIAMQGTIRNPLNFVGADLSFEIAGPDMALLLPLIGLPTPRTPSYHLTGQFAVTDGQIVLSGITGMVGSTDLAGTMQIDATAAPPVVDGDLVSRAVDLADLGGFIGAEPGRMSTPGQSAEQKKQMAAAEAKAKLLPEVPINQPVLRANDIHLRYRAAKVLGEATPFDSMIATLDIVGGHIKLSPLLLGVGEGRIIATIDMVPEAATFHTTADVKLEQIDVGRALAATHLVQGTGAVEGRAHLTAIGDSVAALLGGGDGTVNVYMAGGSSLSALMLDIAGFRFGKAVFSALGIPDREAIRCFAGEFDMVHGVLNTKVFLLDTTGSLVTGVGSIDWAGEMLNLRLKTESKHFSVGTLPAWIGVVGPFKDPAVSPDLAALGVRAGVATGLGFLFPPAALLPTIQLGVGESNRCAALTRKGLGLD